MSNVKIVAKIRYSVEGDLYGKIIFIQDGEYWADDQNYGDDPLEKMTEKDLDMDTSFSLGIAADKPIRHHREDPGQRHGPGTVLHHAVLPAVSGLPAECVPPP